MRVLMLLLALAASSWSQPNFLIFIADDLGDGDLSILGHPVVRTPNIDRLAREGMLFSNAFLTASSCSPSRTSILTGRYPHATQAEDLHTPLPAKQWTVARYLKTAGYFNAGVGKWHLGDAERAHWDETVACSGGAIAAQTIQLLRVRPDGRPFFFWVASSDPHRPIDTDAVAAPYDPAEAVVPPYLPDHPLIRRDLAAYYGEITRFDQQIGRILEELNAQGVLDETFVVFLSDNGMPFPRAKTTLYDSGIRTPFLIRYPPLVKPGSLQAKLLSVADLAPSILELADVSEDTMQGFSRIDMLRIPAAPGRAAVYAEANWHDFEQFTRAVRTDRYLLIRNYYHDKPLWAAVDSVNSRTWTALLRSLRMGRLTSAQRFVFEEPRPFEEFYDLQVDPNSLDNVAEDPRYRDELIRHRILLDNWRVDTADAMPLERRRDGWTRDGRPLPHNQPWYGRFLTTGRNEFDRF